MMMNQVEFEQAFLQLPKRRKEVLLRVLAGQTDQNIATDLKIGETAVRKHIERVSQTFGLQTQGSRRSKRSDVFALVAQYKPELIAGESFLVTNAEEAQDITPITHQDWGEAPDVSLFYGRDQELTTLEQWLIQGQCRVVTIFGIGGVGKTTLAVKLAQNVQSNFDYVIWRSLRYSCSVTKLLTDLIQVLSGKQSVNFENDLGQQISLLINYLRKLRCLIVLDQVENLMETKQLAGHYQLKYQEYGELFRRIGESSHQSCFLLASREIPFSLTTLAGDNVPVRIFNLQGLLPEDATKLLETKLTLSAQEHQDLRELVTLYDGNVQALKIVASTIKNIFGGNVNNFLQENPLVIGDHLGKILREQLQRLSNAETQIMYHLALYDQPITLSKIQDNLVNINNNNVITIIESLVRRSLVEKTILSDGVNFSLQPMLKQYITYQLSQSVSQIMNQTETEENLQLIAENGEILNSELLEFHQVTGLSRLEIAKYVNKIGYQYYQKKELTTAKFYLQWAVKLAPDLIIAHYNLGSIYEKLEQIELACQHYQIASVSQSKGGYGAINNLARLEILRGNYQKAIDLILPILEQVSHPLTKATLHKNLGWAYFAKNHDEEAKQHLLISLELEKNKASAYCLLGKIYQSENEFSKALNSWQSCLECESENQLLQLPELALWKLEARQFLQKINNRN